MKLKKTTTLLMQVLVLTTVMLNCIYANTIIGTLKHTLKPYAEDASSKTPKLSAKNNEKVIQLLHVQLSDEEKEFLTNRAKNALEHTHQFAVTAQKSKILGMSTQVQLDMNNVPVLDQGIHGTCVTFAVTGAIDAVIKQGDYISQLCNLQLGSYLENHGYSLSGWDGSNASIVIDQIEQYGIVNKQKQRAIGCGGLKNYPTYSEHDPHSFIEPEQYHALSEPVFGKVINWSDIFQENDAVKTLNEVKEALLAGDRLVFGVLIPRTDLGTVGAVGKHKTWIYQDTWLLTPEILDDIDNVEAGHEMIITGYDDDALAVDNHGKKHKGLLTLRNSWGASVGNYGEFYMSYDYFKLLASEVTRLTPNVN
jgi:C1A family cysteine protease